MSLNPCFSGGWSRSAAKAGGDQFDAAVLILVLVEDGLGGQTNLAGHPLRDRLNPCFSGGWSRSLIIYEDEYSAPSSLNPCFSGGWSRSAV